MVVIFLIPVTDNVGAGADSQNRSISQIECTCYACPHQLEGYTDRGEYIYVRERWGHVTVSINDVEVGSSPVSFEEEVEGCYPKVVEILNENGFNLSLEEFQDFF